MVKNRILEIRFQYTGKGTTAVPSRGIYGPMVSAISVESGMTAGLLTYTTFVPTVSKFMIVSL